MKITNQFQLSKSPVALTLLIGLSLSACNNSHEKTVNPNPVAPSKSTEAPAPVVHAADEKGIDTDLIANTLTEVAPQILKIAPKFLEINFDQNFLFSDYQVNDGVSNLGTGLRVKGSSSQAMNWNCVGGESAESYPNLASYRVHILRAGGQLKVQVIGQVVKIQAQLLEPTLRPNLILDTPQMIEYQCGDSYVSELNQGGRVVSSWAYNLSAVNLEALQKIELQLNNTWEFENDPQSISKMKLLLNSVTQNLRDSGGGGIDLIDYRGASNAIFIDILSGQPIQMQVDKLVDYVTTLQNEKVVVKPVGGELSVRFERLPVAQ